MAGWTGPLRRIARAPARAAAVAGRNRGEERAAASPWATELAHLPRAPPRLARWSRSSGGSGHPDRPRRLRLLEVQAAGKRRMNGADRARCPPRDRRPPAVKRAACPSDDEPPRARPGRAGAGRVVPFSTRCRRDAREVLARAARCSALHPARLRDCRVAGADRLDSAALVDRDRRRSIRRSGHPPPGLPAHRLERSPPTPPSTPRWGLP